MDAKYVVSMLLERGSSRVDLFYGSYKNAKEAYDRATNWMTCEVAPFSAEDDFGCSVSILGEDVCCVVINDVEKETKKQTTLRIEMDKEYAKQVKAEQRSSIIPNGPLVKMPAANQVVI